MSMALETRAALACLGNRGMSAADAKAALDRLTPATVWDGSPYYDLSQLNRIKAR